MIGLHEIEAGMARSACAAPLGLALAGIVNDANDVSVLLSVADFCGWQEDGEGGRFQLWTLRTAIDGHPAGSTVTPDTIHKALRPNYGATTLPAGKPADFAAVETHRPSD